jgi:ribosomal protein L34E
MLAVNITLFVTVVSLVVAQSQKKSKATPKCRACKKPMKGHKEHSRVTYVTFREGKFYLTINYSRITHRVILKTVFYLFITPHWAINNKLD